MLILGRVATEITTLPLFHSAGDVLVKKTTGQLFQAALQITCTKLQHILVHMSYTKYEYNK
jgi:hypothetical protein